MTEPNQLDREVRQRRRRRRRPPQRRFFDDPRAAFAAVREAVAGHVRAQGVFLDSAIHLTTANRSREVRLDDGCGCSRSPEQPPN